MRLSPTIKELNSHFDAARFRKNCFLRPVHFRRFCSFVTPLQTQCSAFLAAVARAHLLEIVCPDGGCRNLAWDLEGEEVAAFVGYPTRQMANFCCICNKSFAHGYSGLNLRNCRLASRSTSTRRRSLRTATKPVAPGKRTAESDPAAADRSSPPPARWRSHPAYCD